MLAKKNAGKEHAELAETSTSDSEEGDIEAGEDYTSEDASSAARPKGKAAAKKRTQAEKSAELKAEQAFPCCYYNRRCYQQ